MDRPKLRKLTAQALLATYCPGLPESFTRPVRELCALVAAELDEAPDDAPAASSSSSPPAPFYRMTAEELAAIAALSGVHLERHEDLQDVVKHVVVGLYHVHMAIGRMLGAELPTQRDVDGCLMVSVGSCSDRLWELWKMGIAAKQLRESGTLDRVLERVEVALAVKQGVVGGGSNPGESN